MIQRELSIVEKRSGTVENRHLVVASIVDSAGVSAEYGHQSPVFMRSIAKPMQAVEYIRSGIVKQFGLDTPHVAIMCSSHYAQPYHLRCIKELLSISKTTSLLRCGTHPPYVPIGEKFTQFHNNCSGKHAGMLLSCRAQNFNVGSYWEEDHPIQLGIKSTVEEILENPIAGTGVDGCGVPTYVTNLNAIASAFRMMAISSDLHIATVRDAMFASPEFVAGHGQLDTLLLERGLLAKSGSEGMWAVGCPKRKIGLALKVVSGHDLASDVALLFLTELLGLTKREDHDLAAFRTPKVSNMLGEVVGELTIE